MVMFRAILKNGICMSYSEYLGKNKRGCSGKTNLHVA